MVIVNLEAYADFDMPVTEKIMLAPNNMSKQDVNKISYNIAKLSLNDANTDKAFILFKEYGFVEVQHINCCVGGDL